MKKRVLSCALCLCMVLTLLPNDILALGAMKSADSDEPAACLCETECAEGEVNADCPVCGAEGADLTLCTGTATEEPTEKVPATYQTSTAYRTYSTLSNDAINAALPLTGDNNGMIQSTTIMAIGGTALDGGGVEYTTQRDDDDNDLTWGIFHGYFIRYKIAFPESASQVFRVSVESRTSDPECSTYMVAIKLDNDATISKKFNPICDNVRDNKISNEAKFTSNTFTKQTIVVDNTNEKKNACYVYLYMYNPNGATPVPTTAFRNLVFDFEPTTEVIAKTEDTTKGMVATIGSNAPAKTISLGSMKFDETATTKVVALPKKGYDFSGWYVGDTKVSDSTIYAFENNNSSFLSSNTCNLVAKFAASSTNANNSALCGNTEGCTSGDYRLMWSYGKRKTADSCGIGSGGFIFNCESYDSSNGKANIWLDTTVYLTELTTLQFMDSGTFSGKVHCFVDGVEKPVQIISVRNANDSYTRTCYLRGITPGVHNIRLAFETGNFNSTYTIYRRTWNNIQLYAQPATYNHTVQINDTAMGKVTYGETSFTSAENTLNTAPGEISLTAVPNTGSTFQWWEITDPNGGKTYQYAKTLHMELVNEEGYTFKVIFASEATAMSSLTNQITGTDTDTDLATKIPNTYCVGGAAGIIWKVTDANNTPASLDSFWNHRDVSAADSYQNGVYSSDPKNPGKLIATLTTKEASNLSFQFLHDSSIFDEQIYILVESEDKTFSASYSVTSQGEWSNCSIPLPANTSLTITFNSMTYMQNANYKMALRQLSMSEMQPVSMPSITFTKSSDSICTSKLPAGLQTQLTTELNDLLEPDGTMIPFKEYDISTFWADHTFIIKDTNYDRDEKYKLTVQSYKLTWDGDVAFGSVGDPLITKGAVTKIEFVYSWEKVLENASVSMADWTYGETARYPVATSSLGFSASVTYTYKLADASDDTYTATKPTDAGDYVIRASFYHQDYAKTVVTNTFTIHKAKLYPSDNIIFYSYTGNTITPTDTSGRFTFLFEEEDVSAAKEPGTYPCHIVPTANCVWSDTGDASVRSSNWIITKIYPKFTVTAKSPLYYDGEPLTLDDFIIDKGGSDGKITTTYTYASGSGTAGTVAGLPTEPGKQYTITFVIEETSYYSRSVFVVKNLHIQPIPIDPPVLAPKYYTGEEQSCGFVEDDIFMLEPWETSTLTATEVGDYQIAIRIKSARYAWRDGSGYRTVTWSILNPLWTGVSLSTNTTTKIYDGVGYTANDFTINKGDSTNITFPYRLSGETDWTNGLPVNIGDYEVRIVAAGDDTHSETTSEPVNVSISKVQLTPSLPETVSKTYDGSAVMEQSATLVGTPVGQDMPTATVTYTFDDSAAGDRTVSVAVALDNTWGTNYELTQISATLPGKIVPRSITVTGITAENKIYDGTDKATLNKDEMSVVGFLGGDDASIDTITGTFDSADVGENKTVTLSVALKGESKDNYVISSDQATGTATISKAPLSITANEQTISYGDSIATGVAQTTISGLAAGETLTGITLTPSTANVPGGTITPSDAVISSNVENYTITYTTGKLNINKADITINTPTGLTAIYGQTLADLALPYEGITNGLWSWEDSTISVGDVGKHNFTVIFTPNDTTNYNVKKVTVSVTVGQASPAIGEVTYTGDTLYDSMMIDAVTLTRASTTVPGTLKLDDGQNLTAGTNTYNWTFTPKDGVNYKVETGTISLNVTADTLQSISSGATAPNKTVYTYGETFETAGLTITASYKYCASKDVTADVTFGTLCTGDTSIILSYTENGVTKTCEVMDLTVNKQRLAVSGMSWTDGSYTYNGKVQGVTLNGTLPAGVTATKDDDTATDVGDYTATATFALAEGYDAENYEIIGTNPLTKTWSIAGATLTGTKNPVNILRYTTTAPQTLTAADFGITEAGTFTANGAVTDADNVLNATPIYGADVKYQLKNNLDFNSQTVTIPVTFTPDNSNYVPIDLTVTITLTDRNPVTLNLTASKTSGVIYGDSVTYTATLDKGHLTLDALNQLDGEIKFYLDGTAKSNLVGTRSISGSNSTASVTLTFDKLTRGDHTVYAVYDGNAAFANSTANITASVAAKVLTWDVSGLSALKKADGNTAATVKGTLLVSGALAGTDPEFTYTSLTGEYRSAAAGSCAVTVFVKDGKVNNDNYALPVGNPTFTGTINAVSDLTPPPEQGTKVQKLEKEDGISEVPDGLVSNPDLNTPAKIETRMRLSITEANSNIPTSNIKIYDITLQFSTDGGKTWQIADESNFPAEGITIVLPYPEGTSRSEFDFIITHLFTTGAKIGTTETITPEKTEDGLKFVLYSLSPVAVGYQAIASSDTGDTSDTSSSESSNPQTGDTSDTSSSVSSNPQTGDHSHIGLYIFIILLSAAGLVIIVTIKRRQSR